MKPTVVYEAECCPKCGRLPLTDFPYHNCHRPDMTLAVVAVILKNAHWPKETTRETQDPAARD